jgi:hypothetical protein
LIYLNIYIYLILYSYKKNETSEVMPKILGMTASLTGKNSKKKSDFKDDII